MKISIAICTWNRARLLDQTLESISHLNIPHGLDWELVLVDNNSTENAVPLVINGWRKQLPLVSCIEKEQGHSAARNKAVELATGDYIVWTDNDVLVDKNWLASYAKAFRQYPDVDFFGGPIQPVFEGYEPDWISKTWDICAPVYATRDLGNKPIELNEKRLPYGANFAIRTECQRKHLYDTKWGRKTNQMIGEDEVAVLRSILTGGASGRWVPEAKLNHFIPEDRATEKYVASYYYGQGVTNALKGKVSRGRFAIWLDQWKSWIGYKIHRRISKPLVWVSKMVHASICQGELAGLSATSSDRND